MRGASNASRSAIASGGPRPPRAGAKTLPLQLTRRCVRPARAHTRLGDVRRRRRRATRDDATATETVASRTSPRPPRSSRRGERRRRRRRATGWRRTRGSCRGVYRPRNARETPRRVTRASPATTWRIRGDGDEDGRRARAVGVGVGEGVSGDEEERGGAVGGGGDYFASGVVLGETPRGGDGLDVETGLVARLERRESRDAGKRRARFGARLGRGVRHPGPQGEVGVDHARERGVDERGSLLGPRNEGTALEEHPRRLTLGRRGGAKGAWRRQTRDEVVGVTLRVACVKHPGAELEGGRAPVFPRASRRRRVRRT